MRTGLGIAPQHLYALAFPTTQLDRVPMGTLVALIADVFADFQPEEVLLPYPGDVHSDHRVTFQAASACTKWFRHPSVRRVLAYETPSETDFGIDPRDPGFKPNVLVDISAHIDVKLTLLRVYASELGEFPFPRSQELLLALAALRGAQGGCEAAEGFVLLGERG